MIEKYFTQELYQQYVEIGNKRRKEREQREREFYERIQKEISYNMRDAESKDLNSFEVSYEGLYEREWIDKVIDFLNEQGWHFQVAPNEILRFYFK